MQYVDRLMTMVEAWPPWTQLTLIVTVLAMLLLSTEAVWETTVKAWEVPWKAATAIIRGYPQMGADCSVQARSRKVVNISRDATGLITGTQESQNY